MRRGSNLLRLADFNTAVVLDLIRRSADGMTRVEIGERSGLSGQTVNNIARRLIDRDLVREGLPVRGARGKPPVPLLIEPDGCCSLGVHVDPARLTVLLLDLGGTVVASSVLRTPKARYPARVIALISRTAAGLVRSAGVEPGRVLGIGIAAPGPIDVAEGVLVDPPMLPRWRNLRLRADLHTATGLPVLLDKDVTAAATAELRAAPHDSHDFAFLYLGSGVGAGLVLADEVVRGTSNNVGEVGEIVVDPADPGLDWGQRGSLATACMPQALVDRAARRGLLAAPPPGDFVAVDEAFSRLTELAATGNAEAVSIIDHSATRVAIGLAVLVNLLDVDRIVIGGPAWPRLSERYLAVLPGLVAAELVAARRPVPIEGSAIGEHVAAYGAAALVLDHFLAPRPSVLLMD